MGGREGMGQNRGRIWRWCGFCAALLCLLTAVLGGAGAAWGRYRTEQTAGILFQSREPESLRLWGETQATDGAAGSWSELPKTWLAAGDGAELAFCVSNGTSGKDYAEENLSLRIQLTGTLGITDPDRFQVTLTTDSTTGHPVVYTALFTAIPEDSVLYQSVGPGWIYRFCDDRGKEIRWELPGGRLSLLNARLHIVGEADPSLLELRVVADGG